MPKTDVYDHSYPSVPIGGDNPYYCCQYCGKSDPEINGLISNHSPLCAWRIRKEEEHADWLGHDELREVLERFGVMDDELYNALDELIQPGHY